MLKLKLSHLQQEGVIENAKTGDIARIVDVTEKHHGSAGQDGEISARQWAERTDWIMDAMEELKKRRDRTTTSSGLEEL